MVAENARPPTDCARATSSKTAPTPLNSRATPLVIVITGIVELAGLTCQYNRERVRRWRRCRSAAVQREGSHGRVPVPHVRALRRGSARQDPAQPPAGAERSEPRAA